MPKERGAITVLVLVFVAVFLVIWVGLLQLIASYHTLSIRKNALEDTFQVAEAGIDYYRWHLAHDEDDFYDGNPPGTPGPFVHDFKDIDGEIIGQYSLNITPPDIGSTVLTVESTGTLTEYPDFSRTIEVQLGKRSLADYGFLTNSNVWFGDTESTSGKVHSNGGIRFDGTADSVLTSTKPTYVCGPEHGCNYETKPGIWGTGGPQDFWHFPPTYDVIDIDFEGITVDLSDIEDEAEISLGECTGQCKGYHVEFFNDGTLSIYKVKKAWYTSGYGTDYQWGDHYIDIRTEQIINEYNRVAIPSNGLIFIEDKVWVDGVVNGKATIAAANFPAGIDDKSIIINGNLTYLAKDGNHALGLMAQKEVLIPRYSPSSIEINAAMMAQNGACQRYYYAGNILDTIQTYGTIITNGIWTWSWVNGSGQTVSGYQNTVTSYDPNLTYNPPPSFPIMGSYDLISWQEE